MARLAALILSCKRDLRRAAALGCTTRCVAARSMRLANSRYSCSAFPISPSANAFNTRFAYVLMAALMDRFRARRLMFCRNRFLALRVVGIVLVLPSWLEVIRLTHQIFHLYSIYRPTASGTTRSDDQCVPELPCRHQPETSAREGVRPLPLLGSPRAFHLMRTALARRLGPIIGQTRRAIPPRLFRPLFCGDAPRPTTTGVGLFGEAIRFHSPPRPTIVEVGPFAQDRQPLGGSCANHSHGHHAGVLATRHRAYEARSSRSRWWVNYPPTVLWPIVRRPSRRNYPLLLICRTLSRREAASL